MKKIILLFLTIILTVSLTGCGSSGDGDNGDGGSSSAMEKPLSELLDTIYENADFDDPEFRDYLKDYVKEEIPAESAEYIIGTTEVEYTESIYSAPQVNVVPYQCILLRLPEDADVEVAKQTLSEHADPIKWVCVEADSVVIENIGNVVLFIMADTGTAEAVRDAFLALNE